MKPTRVLALLLLMLASCRKEKNEVEIFLPGSQQNGTVVATKLASNSHSGDWNATGTGYRDSTFCCNKIAVKASTYDEFGQQRESLTFLYIPLQIGRYLIFTKNKNIGEPQAIYTRWVSDGDVFGASYEPDDTYPFFGNWIEITEINPATESVKGRFNIRFRIGDSYLENGFPEVVQFKNGQFDVKIIN